MSRFSLAWACALVAAALGIRYASAVRADEPRADEATGQSPPRAARGDSFQGAAAAERRIARILDEPLRAPLSFVETPLNQVLQEISAEYDVPIVFDVAAIEEAAGSIESEVTLELNKVTLRSALGFILDQCYELTQVIEREVLLITTNDKAETLLRVVVYRVDDLVRLAGDLPAESADAYDFDPLIDILTSSVAADSWMENGTGEGEINAYPPGMLIVAQTARVHSEVERVLADMRQVRDEIRAQPAEPALAASGPATRAFLVDEKLTRDADGDRDRIRTAIIRSVDWGAPRDDDERFLAVLPGRIVARHEAHVLRQVERVVRTLRSADKPTARGGAF